jgi:hypothetical protein
MLRKSVNIIEPGETRHAGLVLKRGITPIHTGFSSRTGHHAALQSDTLENSEPPMTHPRSGPNHLQKILQLP